MYSSSWIYMFCRERMQSSMVKLVTLAPGGARLLSTSSRLDRWVLDCQQNGCTLWKLPTPSSTGSSLTSLWWLEGGPVVVGRPTSLQTSSARTRCLVEILSILRSGKFMPNINKCQVAVIEPGEMHYYQPMWTLVRQPPPDFIIFQLSQVGGGLKSLAQSGRPMENCLPKYILPDHSILLHLQAKTIPH